MRLGLHIGYWGLGLTADEQLKLVREAESLGFDSVWSAEAYGSDAATVLAWIAAQTETIKLGSPIVQMPGRSPGVTAMTAVTIDQLSNGRMRLGIGSSGPQVAEGWHGQPFAKQLQRTREDVGIVRMALGGHGRLGGGAPAGGVPRRVLRAADSEWARQGAEADDPAAAGQDPDLHRSY